MADRDFEVSATHVAGMVKAAQRLGVLEQVLPRVSAATRAVLESPHAEKWHPSSVLVELSDALREACGAQTFTDTVYSMTKESFGPIVAPMLRIALTLTGRTPATLFGRLNDSIQLTMRGVSLAFTAQGPQGGVVKVTYPRPVPADVRYAWDGVFRFIFELTGATGAVESFSHDDGGRVLALTVRWR